MSELERRERAGGGDDAIQKHYDDFYTPKGLERSRKRDAKKAERLAEREEKEPGRAKQSYYNASDRTNDALERGKKRAGNTRAGRGVKRARNSRFNLRRKGFRRAGAGIILSLILSLFGAFLSLLPLKIISVLNALQDQVSEIPQAAVEQRMDHLMTRYLMKRAVAAEFGEEAAEAALGPAYVGDGPIDTLFTNWRGAKLEVEFQKRTGFQIVPTTTNLDGSRRDIPVNGYRNPDNFELRSTNGDFSSRDISTRETNNLIKQFTRDTTKRRQIIKRANNRRVLRKKYGVSRWRAFDRAENARSSYNNTKRNFQKFLIKNTVGKVSSRMGLYLACLVDANPGDGGCAEIRRGNTDPETGGRGNPNDNLNDGERAAASDDARAGGIEDPTDAIDNISDGDLRSDKLGKILQKFTIKKLIGSLVGLGLIDTLSSIVDAIDNGALSIIVTDKNEAAYAGYAASILIANDQIKSGEVGPNDAPVLFEILENLEESPVFQVLIAGSPQPDQISRVCQVETEENEDGTITIISEQEELLEPGELVCPDKKVTQNLEKAVTDFPGWDFLSAINDVWNSTFGRIFGWVNSLIGAVTSALGIDDLLASIIDKLGIGKLATAIFERTLGWFIGPVLYGGETDGDAFDAAYAGTQIISNQTGLDSEEGFGNALVTPEVQLAILEDARQYEFETFASRPFSERLFSLDTRHSTASKMLAQIPTRNMTDFAGFIKTLASLPKMSFVAMTSNTAYAQNEDLTIDGGVDSVNPFGNLIGGWDPGHEALTMDPVELWENPEYDCENPDRIGVARDNGWLRKATEEEQQQLGINVAFEVMLVNDPCKLDTSVASIGSSFFTADDDGGLGALGADGVEFTVGNITIGNTTDIPCFDGQEGSIEEGWNSGNRYEIRVCNVEGILVNSQISAQVAALVQDARTSDPSIEFANSWGWRSHQRQIELRGTNGCPDLTSAPSTCNIPTAVPGYSNHQMGLAIDFRCTVPGNGIGTVNLARRPWTEPCWDWLTANAARYGLKNLPSEDWHWSYNGR